MRKKAQVILEYVVLIGIIGLALSAMQYYFRRGIQAVIKVAADEVGDQKKGSIDTDYTLDWKIKGQTLLTSTSSGRKDTVKANGGAVTSTSNTIDQQTGTASYAVWSEK